MARKFMYVCLGILALVLAFHLGARYGRADTIVDHTMTGVVAASLYLYGDSNLLLESGEVWHWNEGNQEWGSSVPPPVPVPQIKFWSEAVVIDTDNQVWVHSGGQWFNRGAPPGGGTLTHSTTWGRIKAGFGE